MHAKCKVTFTKNTNEITNFKMIFEQLNKTNKPPDYIKLV